MEPFSVDKVHDGIYLCREKFFNSPNQANIWLVQGSREDLVIDTGLGLWDLPGFLKDRGLIGDKPVQAVATHVHFDHSGGLHQFEKFSIHSLEANAMREGDNYETVTIFTNSAEITRPPSNGEDWSISDYKVKCAQPSEVLEEGHVFNLGDRSLRVLHLPGHSRGSIGIIDERARILFTGDTMYDGYLIDWLPYSDLTAYIQSCKRLQDLSSQVDTVFPGHFDIFDGKRLHYLATDYISKAGVCHKMSATFLKGIASMMLKAKHTDNIPAKFCYYTSCCCCFFV